MKQKQKIASLQKKLQHAKSEEAKTRSTVEKIASEIDETELSYVRKSLSYYERMVQRWQKDPHFRAKKGQIDTVALFLQEREILQRIIDAGPSPASLEAQGLLDQVLRLITALSEEP